MDRFRIVGPTRLVGTVRASGAKNAALPALAVALLTEAPVRLGGLPRVRDIATMQRLLEHLGVEATAGPETVHGATLDLRTTNATAYDAPYDLVKTMRAGVLVLGPLLARRGEALVSLPGGCAIGVRPIDQHLAGLAALGADVRLEHGYVHLRAGRLQGTRFRFAMPTVTGTENVLMAACLAAGTTVLENCAREPEVVDLGRLLQAMGARIDGLGSPTLTIEGVADLGGADYTIIPDRIEGGTYLIGAALTAGDVFLAGAAAEDLEPLLIRLRGCGAEVDAGPEGIRVRAGDELRPQDAVTGAHPGFPTDLQAQYMVLMTRARGVATICETVFENRFQHVPELARLGASIAVEGRYARVEGPTRLSGTNVMATDLRASASLVLAGLAATGDTYVDRIYHLDRGYEAMEQKLRALGGQVERVGGGSVA
jgi:UDP-N-acetylglucosamine 1-carboxyvinyltransferase